MGAVGKGKGSVAEISSPYTAAAKRFSLVDKDGFLNIENFKKLKWVDEFEDESGGTPEEPMAFTPEYFTLDIPVTLRRTIGDAEITKSSADGYYIARVTLPGTDEVFRRRFKKLDDAKNFAKNAIAEFHEDFRPEI